MTGESQAEYKIWNHTPSSNTFNEELTQSGYDLFYDNVLPLNGATSFDGISISQITNYIESSITNDQKRTLSPKQAIANGSNWLVIGRDITKGNIKKNIKKLIDHLNR